MSKPKPPSVEQETHTLKVALTECRTQLARFRLEHDDLAASLAEADMNTMLDRLAELSRMPRKPRI